MIDNCSNSDQLPRTLESHTLRIESGRAGVLLIHFSSHQISAWQSHTIPEALNAITTFTASQISTASQPMVVLTKAEPFFAMAASIWLPGCPYAHTFPYVEFLFLKSSNPAWFKRDALIPWAATVA